MVRKRVIPCLLLMEGGLYKTVRFKSPSYIGDPINTVRIFNEKEVDELVFLDIRASAEKKPVNFEIISRITNECFMPLAYGGGINKISDVKKLFSMGVEKVIVNSYLYENKTFISEIAEIAGSQSVIASVDIGRNFFGKYRLLSHSATRNQGANIIEWVQELERLGAGELLITSVDREGTWSGMDAEIISEISHSVNIPVIAQGGAGSATDIKAGFNSGASAIAVGSMVVYQKKGFGVLISYPEKQQFN